MRVSFSRDVTRRYSAKAISTSPELVRYIHLNPVRAKMVRRPQDFPYSSHRAYLGLDEAWLVDVEPVLRHFGANKKLARQTFQLFVRAGMKLGYREEFYRADEGRMLGS